MSPGIQESSYIINRKEENLENLNELDKNKFKYYSSILMVKNKSSNEEKVFLQEMYLPEIEKKSILSQRRQVHTVTYQNRTPVHLSQYYVRLLKSKRWRYCIRFLHMKIHLKLTKINQ